MAKRNCRAWVIAMGFLLTAFTFSGAGLPAAAEDKTYVGSESCQECHEDQYDSYSAHSKKAHSYESVKVMRKGLTEAEYLECLQCHATGFGKPGGFTSEDQTPHMQNLGCESCHGPGSDHVDSGDPDDIVGELSPADCERCHNSERVENFKFKPLLFGGAH